MFGYVVDFVCFEARVVVELDGSQHAEHIDYDELRTRTLMLNGFQVLRFWNNDVLKDCEGVLMTILRHLQAPPSPQPSPASGRGGSNAL